MQVTLSQNSAELSLELLHKACAFLIKRHALLRATIERQLSVDPSSGRTLLHTDSSYFVPVRSHDPFEFTNVELIESHEEAAPDVEHSWSQQLTVSELRRPLDVHNGPLWRLKVIKRLTSATYAFIFTFSHVIADGRNMNTIVVELLNILAALMDDKQCVEMSESVESPAGLEDYLLARFVADGSSEKQASKALPRNQTEAVRERVDLSGTSFELCRVDAETMSKLVERLKANTQGRGKLMGLFEVLVCLAYEEFLAKHCGDCEADRPSPKKYRLSVCLREKCGVKVSQMGAFVSGLYVKLAERLDKLLSMDDERLRATVWSLAEQRTQQLHERLKNNEEVQVKLKSLLHNESGSPLFSDITSTESLETFAFTNISNFGVLAQCRDSHLIRITEFYCIFPMIYRQLMMYMGSVDGTFCFSISYNESAFKPEMIRELKQSILTSIHKLVA